MTGDSWRTEKSPHGAALDAEHQGSFPGSVIGVVEAPPPFFGTAHSKGVTTALFVTAHSKGVTTALFVSAHSKGVTDGQLRPKPGKTRCLLITAHSKGLSRVNSRQFTVNSSRRVRQSPHGAAPDAGDECLNGQDAYTIGCYVCLVVNKSFRCKRIREAKSLPCRGH